MRIRINTILAVIPVDINLGQVKPLEFHYQPSSPAGLEDGIAILAFITFIFAMPAAPWHSEMKFVIYAIVGYRDVWVGASDLILLKLHFGGQIIPKNIIVNTRCFNADHHSRCSVLLLSVLTLAIFWSVLYTLCW
jgi:hypothetical protein